VAILCDHDTPSSFDLTKLIEDKLLLKSLYDTLNDEERNFYNVVYVGNQKLSEYAHELQKADTDTKLMTIQKRLYRIRDSIKAKAERLS
jgi:hypothetical protein